MKSVLSIFGAAAFASVAICGSVLAAQYDVLYAFSLQSNGDTPRGTLFRDSHGNLYGTTLFGGEYGCACGNIFKISANGTETVLYTFQDKRDGAYPYSGVVQDTSGNLYGTTFGDQYDTFGSLYKLDPQGGLTTLHTFCSLAHCTDGSFPVGGVVRDSYGNLYGTTELGGANGYGTIYEYSTTGTFSVLHSFRDGNDGGYPLADLIRDSANQIYGTASQGGLYGGGTVFKFSRNRYTILHNFTGGTDGAYPEFALRRDSAGNLYGTTSAGGTGCTENGGCGTIFRIAPDKTETILYRFQGGSDGSLPSGVVLDSSGNMYGGSRSDNKKYQGAIFKLAVDGTFSVLRNLSCEQDGCIPFDSLIKDRSGNLYGTMAEGGTTSCHGYYCGTVFRLVP